MASHKYWVDTSAGGLLVTKDIIQPAVSFNIVY